MPEFTQTSTVDAPVERVWERIITPEGVNAEFRPLFRMTFPKEIERLTPDSVPLGERLCRSWILLFGVLPIDYDDVTLVRVDPPHGFLERSPMLSMRAWEHERTLEPAEDGRTRVTDRIRFEPRISFMGALARPIYRAVFRRRHRLLGRSFA